MISCLIEFARGVTASLMYFALSGLYGGDTVNRVNCNGSSIVFHSCTHDNKRLLFFGIYPGLQGLNSAH